MPYVFLLIFVIWAHLDKNKSSRPRFVFGLCPIASPTKILLAAQNLQTLSCLVCSHCQSVHTFPQKNQFKHREDIVCGLQLRLSFAKLMESNEHTASI